MKTNERMASGLRGFLCATLITAALTVHAQPAEPAQEQAIQEGLRGMSAETSAPERLKRAHALANRHLLSSLQVKAIVARLPDDTSRYDFALAAYPRTVDPENFYEVYDAFSALSKVMRLHDQIRHMHAMPPGLGMPSLAVTEEALQSILQSLRKESFDNTRSQVARQIVSTTGKRFFSKQMQQILRTFDFENSRLELAKFAYEYVLDPEMYFLVNDAFDFDGSKQSLTRHIQSKQKPNSPENLRPR